MRAYAHRTECDFIYLFFSAAAISCFARWFNLRARFVCLFKMVKNHLPGTATEEVGRTASQLVKNWHQQKQ